jgi:hypothetical protein
VIEWVEWTALTASYASSFGSSLRSLMNTTRGRAERVRGEEEEGEVGMGMRMGHDEISRSVDGCAME